MFGVHRRTYQDWERGVAEPPGTVGILLDRWAESESAVQALERARRDLRKALVVR